MNSKGSRGENRILVSEGHFLRQGTCAAHAIWQSISFYFAFLHEALPPAEIPLSRHGCWRTINKVGEVSLIYRCVRMFVPELEQTTCELHFIEGFIRNAYLLILWFKNSSGRQIPRRV